MDMENEIKAILARVVPGAFTIVRQRVNGFDKSNEIIIMIAATDDEINRVRGQYPACVSLLLNLDRMELVTQVFGGNGGGSFHRLPRKHVEAEKYLALQSIKVPFRKPIAKPENVLKAIEGFATKWKALLAENIDEMPHGFDYKKALQ